MARMTGGGALVEMLTRHGVDTLFALPGVQNDALFVALYDAGEQIAGDPSPPRAGRRLHGVRLCPGERQARRLCGGAGTGAAQHHRRALHRLCDQSPVLCISGQIPSNLIGRGFGLLHEIPDQLAILRGLTKWAERINHPTETGKLVNEAFRQLADGRPRPVALEMPLDIMALESEVALPDGRRAPAPPPPPDSELIDKAAALLAAAKQPMIYIGSGCAEAGAELLAVAEKLQAPVVTYTGGKGIVSDRHYLAQNLLAGHDLWRGDRCRAGGRHPLQPAADPLGARRRHQGDPHRPRPGRDHPDRAAGDRHRRRRETGARGARQGARPARNTPPARTNWRR